MHNRLKLLKQNRQLILETLEHVQNVTNLGIRVTENPHGFTISLPNEIIPVSDTIGNRSFIKSGAQLVFTQNPNEGIKIRHILPQVKKPGKTLTGEVVTVIPSSRINREVIFKTVIEFLERVKEVQKGNNAKT